MPYLQKAQALEPWLKPNLANLSCLLFKQERSALGLFWRSFPHETRSSDQTEACVHGGAEIVFTPPEPQAGMTCFFISSITVAKFFCSTS